MSVELAGGVPALHPERRGQLNISPKSNWVEKRGGLPSYINAIATALVRQGMTRQRAIAVAVNSVKRTCTTGYWGGNPKINVSAAIKGAACAAVAQWEAMKVSTSVPSDERLTIELARRWEAEDSIELAWGRLRARALLDLAFREADHPGNGNRGRGSGSRTRSRLRRTRDMLRRASGVGKVA